MQIGVFFPQLEMGPDPVAIRDFAQAAEDLGYDFIEAMDHILGVDPASRPGFRGPYTHTAIFHEPFVLMAYVAGFTKRLGLMTAVMVLPQRQTALFAKQAAELDVLSGGRLRIGIGVGWNRDEYEAVGASFRDRGARCDEQIEVLRRLWTQELVTFKARFHDIRDAGINPLPVQRPIPLWLGGMADAVMTRLGRLGDGWLPKFPQIDARLLKAGLMNRAEAPEALIARVHDIARAAGRDPAAIGLEGRINMVGHAPDDWQRELDAWRAIGATHMHIHTMSGGLDLDGHIALMRRFRAEVGVAA